MGSGYLRLRVSEMEGFKKTMTGFLCLKSNLYSTMVEKDHPRYDYMSHQTFTHFVSISLDFFLLSNGELDVNGPSSRNFKWPGRHFSLSLKYVFRLRGFCVKN